MKHIATLMLLSTLFLSGCTSLSPFHGRSHAIPNQHDYAQDDWRDLAALSTLTPKVLQPKVVAPVIPTRPKPIRPASPTAQGKSRSVASTIDHANQQARIKPDSGSYQNAIMQYTYHEGGLYQIYTAPLRVTAIQLQANEKIIGKPAAGDTTRWILGVSDGYIQGQPRKTVMIKPTAPNLKTTLIINTNRRTYLLELTSYKETYMAAVNWRYPQDELRARQQAAQQRQQQLAQQQQAARAAQQMQRYFNYSMTYTGKKPKWIPVQVFDDNNKVYIRFSKDRQRYEAPALFVIDSRGKTQLVNYRVEGDFYIVDRLFETAELRTDNSTQTVITIKRTR